jgi:uncharacterized protein YbjT (DUF2867 family)
LEELAEEKGVKWTVLRPGCFMENIGQGLNGVKNGSDTFVYANTNTPMIGTVDIGRSAAACLASSDVNEHHKKFYELSGPEFMSGEALAKAIGKKLSREIKYEAVPKEQFAYWPEALAQVMLYCVEHGKEAAPKTDDVLRLTGRNFTFEEFLDTQL